MNRSVYLILFLGSVPCYGMQSAQDKFFDAVQDNDCLGVLAALAEGANINKQSDRFENSGTALHHAVLNNLKSLMLTLISRNAFINCRDRYGNAPVRLAVQKGNREMVEILLDYGAHPNSIGFDSLSLLHEAVERENLTIATLLLERKADVDGKPLRTERASIQTPLHCALRKGYKPLAKLLLEHNANRSIKTSRDELPIHLAAEQGNLELLSLLLAYDDNILDALDVNRNTPLRRALLASRYEAARHLIINGSPLPTHQENLSMILHPLELASVYGFVDVCIGFLMLRAVALRDSNLALYFFNRHKNYKVLRLSFETIVESLCQNWPVLNGISWLDAFKAIQSETDLKKLLSNLADKPADSLPILSTAHLHSALLCSVRRKKWEIIPALLAAGTNPFEALKNVYKLLPKLPSIRNKAIDRIRVLLEKQALLFMHTLTGEREGIPTLASGNIPMEIAVMVVGIEFNEELTRWHFNRLILPLNLRPTTPVPSPRIQHRIPLALFRQ